MNIIMTNRILPLGRRLSGGNAVGNLFTSSSVLGRGLRPGGLAMSGKVDCTCYSSVAVSIDRRVGSPGRRFRR